MSNLTIDDIKATIEVIFKQRVAELMTMGKKGRVLFCVKNTDLVEPAVFRKRVFGSAVFNLEGETVLEKQIKQTTKLRRITMSFDTNATLNGTDGRLWINNTPCGSIQSFVLHQTNVYEDVNKSGKLTKSRRVVGVELTGTISKYKIDNTMVSLMEEYKDGEMPEIKLIALMQNPKTGMMQRATIKGVTFGEMDIFNFEQKVLAKEEIPFEAEDYKYQDKT